MISFIEFLFLAAAVSSLATGISLLSVNPFRSINQIFAMILAIMALWFICTFIGIREVRYYTPETSGLHIFWFRLGAAIAGTIPWFMQALITSIACPALRPLRVFQKILPWLILPTILGLLCFSESYIPSESGPNNPARGYGYPVFVGVLLIQIVFLIFAALNHMRRLTGVARIEMQLFVLNTGLACIVVVVSTCLGRLLNLPMLSRTGPFVLFLLCGLTVWLICSHKIFDARQVIASAARKGLLFFIFALGTVSASALPSKNLGQPLLTLIAAIFGVGIAGLVDQLTRRWFGLDHDYRIAAPRQHIVALARRTPGPDELKACFEQFLTDWCQCGHASIFAANNPNSGEKRPRVPTSWESLSALCKEGWLTPEQLQRSRPSSSTQACLNEIRENQLGLVVTAPAGSDKPTLILALGTKKSLRPYTYPEIRVLLDLAELMDNTLSHANLSAHATKLSQLESAMMISRSLAHDLGNLTTPIASFLLHTEGRVTPGTPEAEVHKAASHSIKVMDEYIRESLFYSRRLAPNFKSIDPRDALAVVTKLAQDRASRRSVSIQMHCEVQQHFLADPILFSRLATNLINNAIDAADSATPVIVRLSKESAVVILTVSNRGAAIPSENLKRIFDPYFTTKNTGSDVRGVGLGLAICRKIAELHGGQVDVDSRDGITDFVATFPQAVEFSDSSSTTATGTPSWISPAPLQPHLA